MRITVYADFYQVVTEIPDTAAGAGRYIKRSESWKSLEALLMQRLKALFPNAVIHLRPPYENPQRGASTPDFAVEWSHSTVKSLADYLPPQQVLTCVSETYYDALNDKYAWLVTEEEPEEEEETWNERTAALLERVVAWMETHVETDDAESAQLVDGLRETIDGLS